MTTRKLYWIAPVLATLAACSKPPVKETEAPAPVQVTAVTQATIRRIVNGDGILFPRDQANVMPKISAPVQKFHVNRGDHVKAGQMVAELENHDLTAAAAEGKGAIAQADANLRATEGATVPDSIVKAQTDVDSAREARDNTKKVLDSREQLFRQGALAHRLVDESQLAYAQALAQFRAAEEHLKTLQMIGRETQIQGAAAQVESAKAHYESLQAQVAYSRVTSPIAGVVADRPINVGEMANPGAPIITIVDISRVVARVNIPQVDASVVKIGQTATITQPGGTEQHEGKVTVVSPASDANSTTVQVWVEAVTPGERFKPGAAVHAVVVAEQIKAATVVPIAAILPGEEGGQAVLVVDSSSIVHRRAVRLGVRDGDKVQVENGARPGEEVVIQGGMGLDDKAKVKVIDTTVREAEDEDENAPEAPASKDQKKDEAKPKSK